MMPHNGRRAGIHRHAGKDWPAKGFCKPQPAMHNVAEKTHLSFAFNQAASDLLSMSCLLAIAARWQTPAHPIFTASRPNHTHLAGSSSLITGSATEQRRCAAARCGPSAAPHEQEGLRLEGCRPVPSTSPRLLQLTWDAPGLPSPQHREGGGRSPRCSHAQLTGTVSLF